MSLWCCIIALSRCSRWHTRSDQWCPSQPRSWLLLPPTHWPLSTPTLRPRPLRRCPLEAARWTTLRAWTVRAGFIVSATRHCCQQNWPANGGRESKAITRTHWPASVGHQCQIREWHWASAAASEGHVRGACHRQWTQLTQLSVHHNEDMHDCFD